MGAFMGEACRACLRDEPDDKCWIRSRGTRTARNGKYHQGVDESRDGFHPDHPAPGVFAQATQQVVGQKSDQDAKNDVELVQAHELAPVARRSSQGDRLQDRAAAGCGSSDLPR